MRTLEQAICECTRKAEANRELAKYNKSHVDRANDLKNAEEHKQLVAWLRELVERRKAPEIIRCGECAYREIRGVDGFCDHITGEPIMVKKTDHCSWAERKTE